MCHGLSVNFLVVSNTLNMVSDVVSWSECVASRLSSVSSELLICVPPYKTIFSWTSKPFELMMIRRVARGGD